MKPIRNAAKAIIVLDQQLLTVQMLNKAETWYLLPGGGQEPGETFHQTLHRECMEEAGAQIDIGPLRFIREYIGRNHEFAHEDHDVDQIEFMFLCRLKNPMEVGQGAIPDPGQQGIKWLDLGNLLNYRLFPLSLRLHLMDLSRQDAPIYLGDSN